MAFLGGILVGAGLNWPMRLWLGLGGALVVLALAGRRAHPRLRIPGLRLSRPPPLPFTVLFLAALAGGVRYQAAQPRLEPGFIAWYNDTGNEMVVVGVVRQPADRRDTYVNVQVAVERARPAQDIFHTAVRGTLLARLPPQGDWRYGDRLVLRGVLETPPADEAFSYRDYLARRGVYSLMPDASAALLESGQGQPFLAAVYALQSRALESVYSLYPDPEASLLAGILLGVETGIPRPVQEAFQATGASHVIAISGFNITILAGLFMAAFGRILGPRPGALAAALGIGAYTLLVGADAAVVRAAIMGGLALLARQVGRRQAALNSLAFTAALMALAHPLILWDVGFQLSFAATLGLVLYADPLAQAFIGLAARRLPEEQARRLAGPAGEYLLFTLAAQATTLPVTAYHFGRLSWTALLVNPLILPAQPAVMVLGGLAVLLELVWLPLGRLAAALAWPFVAYTIRVVEACAALPGGVLFLGPVELPLAAGFYALLLGATLAAVRAGPQARAWMASLRPGLALTGLALVTVLTWRAALAAPDGHLHLTVLDVGSGDGLLIESPTGRYVLVDGGPRASLLSSALGRRLPPGRRRLDYVVVAAPYEGQVGALAQAWERFPPERVLWAGPPQASRPARALQAALAQAGVPVAQAEAGQALSLGGGAWLRVLAVGRRGAVLLLEYGRFRALLPMGLDFELLGSLDSGRAVGPVSALLLAESGYAPLNPAEWLANLQPRVALLSVAAGDWQGLPSRETLAALQGYPLLRTDRKGWIELESDGERMWVAVERGAR
jgi:competence protein ComEC